MSTFSRRVSLAVRASTTGALLFAGLACNKLAQLTTDNYDKSIGSVNIFPASADIDVGDAVTFECVAKDKGGRLLPTTPIWEFSASPAGTVSMTYISTSEGGKGLLTGLAPGPARASCNVAGGNNGASANVTVHGHTVDITPSTTTLVPNATEVLTAFVTDRTGKSVSPAPGALVWSSDATSIATVTPISASGARVTAGRAGPPVAVITAEYRVGGRVAGKATASITVVDPPALTVAIAGSTFSMAAGTSVLLTITVRDAAGNVIGTPSLQFSSNSNGQLVVLTSTATSVVVRGLSPGVYQFTVTATANGQTGSATVTLTVT